MAVTRNNRTDCWPWRTLAALLVASAVAAPVRCLEIAVEAPVGDCTSAQVVAISSDERHEWRVAVPSTTTRELDPDHAWTISAGCPGTWAQAAHVDAHPENAEVRLRLVPAGRLVGRLEVAEGQSVGERIEIRLQPARPGAEVGWQSATVDCSLDADRFDCTVPAGEVDLRVAAEDFAPHYAWNTSIAAGESLDLGLVVLVEGASITGSVVIPRGETTSAAEVAVSPLVEGTVDDEDQRRLGLRRHAVATDETGRFQAKGLSAGSYELSVNLPGHSPTRISPIPLKRGEEWFVERPIALDPLITLQVYLDPPQDVDGRPWHVRLLGEPKVAAGATLRDEIAQGAATTAGHWSEENLPTGPYLLQVEDDGGSVWSQLPVDLTASSAPLFVELPAVTVEGEVLRGDEPVAAKLIFGTSSGRPSVSIESDEEGRFSGVLPHEGEWPLEIARVGKPPQALDPVDVERGAGGVAELTVRLPDTHLDGEVVDANGEPVANAVVLVLREDAKPSAPEREAGVERRRRREANLRSDHEGQFAIDGLLPAPLSVVAYDRTRTSRWHQVELSEGAPAAPIRLVLEARSEVTGVITTAEGPVAGATVIGFSRDSVAPLDLFAQAVSSADGRFSFEVTAGTRLLDLLVAAPGHDVTMRRVALGSQPLIIAVSRSEGRLLLQDLGPGTTLLHSGAEVPIETLASLLVPLGRLDFAEDGLWIAGVEPGGYALCTRQAAGCDSGNLIPGAELTLKAHRSTTSETTP